MVYKFKNNYAGQTIVIFLLGDINASEADRFTGLYEDRTEARVEADIRQGERF